jgi:multiple sugar transport system substrate-binding protein
MPVEMSPLVVYWNRALVSRRALAGQDLDFPRGAASWTWETFEAAARAAAEKDRLGPVKGTWLPPRLDLLTALLRSSGGDVADDELEPTSLSLSSEDTIETMTALVHLASDPVVSLTPADLARRDAVRWFTDGDLGLLVGTRADLPRLRAAAEDRGLDFGVVSLPSFGRATSVSRATGLCVSAHSDAAAAATDFVAWAVGPRAARMAAATGEMVPSRLETLNSDAFTQPGLPPRHSEAFVAAAKRSQPPPYSPVWPQVTTLADAELERLFSPRSADLGPRALTRRLARLDEQSQSVLGNASAD